jgi:hypothetical protein
MDLNKHPRTITHSKKSTSFLVVLLYLLGAATILLGLILVASTPGTTGAAALIPTTIGGVILIAFGSLLHEIRMIKYFTIDVAIMLNKIEEKAKEK